MTQFVVVVNRKDFYDWYDRNKVDFACWEVHGPFPTVEGAEDALRVLVSTCKDTIDTQFTYSVQALVSSGARPFA